MSATNGSRLVFDSHMHTPLCGHAFGFPEEYAAQGLQVGLKGICITCHSPMPNEWFSQVRMAPHEFDLYLALVRRAADHMRDRIEIRLGMESDYFPGMEDWLAELHGKADFDFVLGSLHYFAPEYVERYAYRGYEGFVKTYFQHLGDLAESGLFDAVAHPDLIKNLDPKGWSLDRFREDVEQCLDRIAEAGLAMELNTSGRLKDMPETNPGLDFLRLMRQRDIPVVLGSDSHLPDRVGDYFSEALALLGEAGYTHIVHFASRQPMELDIAKATASLAPQAEDCPVGVN